MNTEMARSDLKKGLPVGLAAERGGGGEGRKNGDQMKRRSDQEKRLGEKVPRAESPILRESEFRLAGERRSKGR